MNAMTMGLNLPATRGRQGGRTMYQLTVPNAVLNNFFTVNMDPPSEKSQRELDPRHAAGIAEYLVENIEGYVLGALIYAVDQECEFASSDLHPDLGVLTIPFGTNLRSLDGQHRRKGLNDAIAAEEALASDSTSVVIYVEPDVVNRRQMFSDMNSTPRKVSKALNVAFDHRDPFARVAIRLANEHPLLQNRIEMERPSVAPSSDAWFTLGAVHDALKRTYVGTGGRVKNPSSFAEVDIEDRGNALLELLGRIPQIESVANGSLSISEARSSSIVFSSTTLRAIAGAYFLFAKARGGSSNHWGVFGERIGAIDFSTLNPEWTRIGFLSTGKSTPNARLQEVRRAAEYLAGAFEA